MKIKDVTISKLKIIEDERGKVMHMMRNDSKVFQSFGEIYFSTIYKDVIKAWHLHKEATLNYASVSGEVKLVLYDDRTERDSRGIYEEIFLTPENYFLVTIPPNIWNGFKGLAKGESIIANCLNLPNNEKEMVRLDIKNKRFNHNW